MTANDPQPPVSDDDFPEFAEPPRNTPPPGSSALGPKPAENAEAREAREAQKAADELMERLRRKRAGRED